MPDMTGSILIHGGVVKADQVKQARTLATRSGATLGECLVAMGAVTEEQLVDFYQRRLMIPRLDERQLSNVAARILGLVPADMAVEFRVVPVGLSEGNLLLAMSDPSDNHAVDEIGFFAGHFVLRHCAAESTVHGAIERLYGVQLPVPEVPVLLQKKVSGPATLPSDVPITLTPKVIPLRPTTPVTPAPTESANDHDNSRPVLLTKVKRPERGSPEQPILLTKPAPPPPAPPPVTPPPPTTPAPTTRERDTLPQFQAYSIPEAPLQGLRNAVNRDEIATLLLDYFVQLGDRATLLIAQKEILTAKDGRNLDAGVVQKLAIPLGGPSIFHDVVASRLPYRGPLPRAAGDQAFAYAVGGVKGEVLIMPIAVRDRIVAVIYADGTRQPLPDSALHATTREAGLAYERIILRAKR